MTTVVVCHHTGFKTVQIADVNQHLKKVVSLVTNHGFLLTRYCHTIYMGGGPRVVVSTAAFHAKVRGSVPGLEKVSIVGSLRDREVACSASDRQGSNFESCVWRTVSSQSSHHPQEVLLAQFSLYVHKGGLKPDSFHFATPYSNEKFGFFRDRDEQNYKPYSLTPSYHITIGKQHDMQPMYTQNGIIHFYWIRRFSYSFHFISCTYV